MFHMSAEDILGTAAAGCFTLYVVLKVKDAIHILLDRGRNEELSYRGYHEDALDVPYEDDTIAMAGVVVLPRRAEDKPVIKGTPTQAQIAAAAARRQSVYATLTALADDDDDVLDESPVVTPLPAFQPQLAIEDKEPAAARVVITAGAPEPQPRVLSPEMSTDEYIDAMRERERAFMISLIGEKALIEAENTVEAAGGPQAVLGGAWEPAFA